MTTTLAEWLCFYRDERNVQMTIKSIKLLLGPLSALIDYSDIFHNVPFSDAVIEREMLDKSKPVQRYNCHQHTLQLQPTSFHSSGVFFRLTHIRNSKKSLHASSIKHVTSDTCWHFIITNMFICTNVQAIQINTIYNNVQRQLIPVSTTHTWDVFKGNVGYNPNWAYKPQALQGVRM